MLNKKTFLKAACGLAALGVCANASAYIDMSQGHAYVGLQAGYANHDLAISDFPTVVGISKIDDSGWGGRIYGGYQFNQNWGAELGLALFEEGDITVTGTKMNVQQHIIDLMAKGTMPFSEGFSVYGKVGPAYVMQDRDAGLGSDENEITLGYGIGAGYDIMPNVNVDASFTQYLSRSNLGDAYLVAVGATYHFA